MRILHLDALSWSEDNRTVFPSTLHIFYNHKCLILRCHPLSTYAKFSEKLTCTCAYQGVRNVSFPEIFAYVLNGWPLISSFSFLFYPSFLLCNQGTILVSVSKVLPTLRSFLAITVVATLISSSSSHLKDLWISWKSIKLQIW